MSELGQPLSDDSLTIPPDGPDGPAVRRAGLGALKRDARARLGSRKRIAISASPVRPLGRHVRKTAVHLADWDPPRERGPRLTPEERLQALELQQAMICQQLGEHTKMGVDIRRDVFGKFGAVAGQMDVVEGKFAEMEKALDAKITEIDLKLDLLARQLEKAEVQRPTDGRMVAEGFGKLTADIEALKKWSGTVFTNGMGL